MTLQLLDDETDEERVNYERTPLVELSTSAEMRPTIPRVVNNDAEKNGPPRVTVAAFQSAV